MPKHNPPATWAVLLYAGDILDSSTLGAIATQAEYYVQKGEYRPTHSTNLPPRNLDAILEANHGFCMPTGLHSFPVRDGSTDLGRGWLEHSLSWELQLWSERLAGY